MDSQVLFTVGAVTTGEKFSEILEIVWHFSSSHELNKDIPHAFIYAIDSYCNAIYFHIYIYNDLWGVSFYVN